jgi:cytidylate kinase
MKITISGIVGSGKSCVSRKLAERLGFDYHSVGKIMRQMASERKISLVEFSKIAEKDNSIDVELDEIQIEIGKTQDNFVMDSRLGFHFIPDSFKVFLDVSLDKAVGRINRDKRHDEKYRDFDDAKKGILKRIDSEKRRYKEYYGIDFPEGCEFDLKIDTNEKSVDEVVEEIISALK